MCWSVASSEEASFAKASASVFCSRGTWTRVTSSNQFMAFLTSSRYLVILSSLALYSLLTCPTINCESLWILSLVAPSSLAILRLVSRASYSASLFVVGYWSRVECFSRCPFGVLKTILTPPAPLTEDLSISTSQCLFGFSSGGSSSATVNSAMKFARAYALIACLG